MSAEKAAPDAPAAKAGKKKLVIIVAAVLVLVLGGGGAAVYVMKSKAAAKAAAEAEADGGEEAKKAEHGGGGHADAAHPPTFLPLDPFVVNLADKDSDRYVQIGITLEVDNALFADQMKGYMPAIRNTILLIIAGKTSRDLLDRHGKVDLADEIQREAVRPMGIDIPVPPKKMVAALEAGKGEQDEVAAKDEKAEQAEKTGKVEKDDDTDKPKTKKKAAVPNPIHHVHFSSFIIQ